MTHCPREWVVSINGGADWIECSLCWEHVQKYSNWEPKSKYLIAQFDYFGPRWWPCVSCSTQTGVAIACVKFLYSGRMMILHTCRHLLHSTKPTTPLWTSSNGTQWNRELKKEHLSGQKEGQPLSITSTEATSAAIHGLMTSIPFHSFVEVSHIGLSCTKVEEWINTTSQTKSFAVNVLELSVLNTNILWQCGEGGSDCITQTYMVVPSNFRLNLKIQRFTLYDIVSRVYIF